MVPDFQRFPAMGENLPAHSPWSHQSQAEVRRTVGSYGHFRPTTDNIYGEIRSQDIRQGRLQQAIAGQRGLEKSQLHHGCCNSVEILRLYP